MFNHYTTPPNTLQTIPQLPTFVKFLAAMRYPGTRLFRQRPYSSGSTWIST